VIETKDAEAAARLKEKYAARPSATGDELKDIQTDAKKLEAEIQAATGSRQPLRFGRGLP